MDVEVKTRFELGGSYEMPSDEAAVAKAAIVAAGVQNDPEKAAEVAAQAVAELRAETPADDIDVDEATEPAEIPPDLDPIFRRFLESACLLESGRVVGLEAQTLFDCHAHVRAPMAPDTWRKNRGV